MSQAREKIVRRLSRAKEDQAPVTLRRKHLDTDRTTGFVLALTDDWVVLHELDGVYLGEVVLLRLDLVTKVEVQDADDEAFIRRAVAGLGVPVETFACAPDASVADLLRVVDQRAELVGVHLESPEGDWFNVGKIRRIGKKRLDLQFIGRDGVWVDYADAWKLSGITRIEFGGAYLDALERFGDPMPPVVGRTKR